MDAKNKAVDVSIIFPVYNESGNLSIFIDRILKTMEDMGGSYEMIAIDDGSTDDSCALLLELEKTIPSLSTIQFQRNFGQTAAISAGIERACGDILITIDSDLENDPNDIPLLISKLNDNYDVVSGWRKGRWSNAFITRRIPSIVANKIISILTGVHLHDYGCTLKAYKSHFIKDVRLYGEMHRFIPAYVAWQGGRVAEIPVSHTPRIHGVSNYGFGRVPRVLLDLIVIIFLHRYMNRPMHFFGGLGLVSLILGIIAGLSAAVLKILHLKDFVSTPLPILAALLIIVGVQLTMFGVIGEMLMRTYYESQGKRPYVIKLDNSK